MTADGRAAALARRAFDLVCAALILVVSAPAFAVAALAVWLESGRPVLFGHRRLGRDGKPFRCWKLRTMRPDAEAALEDAPDLRRRYIENGFKLPTGADPRVTRVGRWLRDTYLDELPQVFNVLDGTMSLVGPRPVVEDELAEYAPHGAELLRVKPGIVGAWTSCGRARPSYPERARLELDYVRHRTMGRDVVILLRSIGVVLRGQDGA